MVTVALLLLMSAAAPKPPGELIDVAGYRVHIHCSGSGTPAVIIVGGFSFDWDLVQPEVAKFARVCTYDASGTAWSDPGPDYPTCSGRVEEIHRMLKAANIDAPYVMTGFSIGALYGRIYARDYPNGLAGMVIVDHAFLPPKTPSLPVVSGPDSPPSVIFAAPLIIGPEDEPGYEKLPRSVQDLQKWAELISTGKPTADLAESCAAQIGDAKLGDLPLAVISTANDSRGYADLQKQLLALSSNSRQFIADRSFHSIEISQPEIVVEAIRQIVKATRK